MSDAEAYRTVRHELDGDRARLWNTMVPGRWYEKEHLRALTGISTHAQSARFSELNALGLTIEKRKHTTKPRTWVYRRAPPVDAASAQGASA